MEYLDKDKLIIDLNIQVSKIEAVTPQLLKNGEFHALIKFRAGIETITEIKKCIERGDYDIKESPE